jgi:hypothetical protein
MREIRQSGSVRGVRRNPYPYRDGPPADAEGSVLLLLDEAEARTAVTGASTASQTQLGRPRRDGL